MPINNRGIAAPAPGASLGSWEYEVRDLRDDDVLIEVHYCGICHSDIHMVNDDWAPGTYPMVPGHEFAGVITEVGSKVTKHAVGDRVGVGCMVGSCRECPRCERGEEQYCRKRIDTYSGKMPDGEITYGGYGKYVVCQEHWAVKIPDSIELEYAAPLLCAGITTYSPCKYNKLERGGLKVGVIGLGGLGHMAVQWLHAMGNEVYVISRSTAKRDLAMKLGATDLIAIGDEETVAKMQGTLNYIIDTVSDKKPMNVYMSLLDVEGILVTVGLPPTTVNLEFSHFPLVAQRKSIQGSLIGGIAETQEMVNYAAEKGIKPYIEVIKGDIINEAYQRVKKGDVQFRFVIDVRATHA
eukprot:Protomagalhaensia_sp_Gyna_25__2035@NODE_2095_length_1295_cov_869_593153_g1732_i0_p1_GENE_NODE_2095_length_1295_cov_869_593153_g1732_i0NODE_2095_length_1295_cov_869_593153_g1732_i0_p1_ORF_typecomplete_len352_score65_87ADH_N/PF08240_12/1_4e33ADH_zinc_N/PF00107_26/1_9e20ADH_zinc_N/PF00107_26/2e03Glu_dehyd_C/PF16912_5/5_6e13AlaDh_PNT_C/PF01262_21/5_4e052Hacid_dh_C/PF02826_19/0_00025NAD_binding_2/PF03446_15/0_00056Shikimate_DH/PF01488_20/0_0013Pyr_redox_2/PF07992_14/0_0089IlvN/PF07991_12/0_0089Pyr_re